MNSSYPGATKQGSGKLIHRPILHLLLITLHPLLVASAACNESPLVFDFPISDDSLNAFHEKAKNKLGHADVLRAKFTQHKKIKALKRPLVSSGSFIVVRNHGVGWLVEKPIQTRFVMTPDALIQEDAMGKKQSLPVDRHPWARLIADAFLSIYSGNADAMDQHFSIFYRESGSMWFIGLKPRDKRLKQIFNHVLISGVNERLDQVIMDEAAGDVTTINFSELKTEPRELNEDEHALFGGSD